ncbi:NAD-dependent succinate-semialdehyde dehydrogenase [Amylibacter sp. SFDW26]|uniref:NAD-dependent succinate-semialdehyde dehydrogenase n=1 Tax=Amylibacter sp. SFDW26 TaxID=2652722 RepID=UPI0012621219|nr:NAD-dependent succinate-semialdehyde dehydrogenase [Amylibacter sp. SFDW26]KAB7616091.1 NAD-dependent succinate-semialdehyde dehydrogenase [Amylibacter sp. SFDW26]
MAYEKLELFIDGKWSQGTSGKSQDVINPATEEVLGTLPHASTADLDAALTAADKGFKIWRNTTPIARQIILDKAADLMEERKPSIAKNISREMGKPVGEASLEMDFVIGCLRWDAEQGKRAYGRLIPARIPGQRQMMIKEPVGPVAAFVAWNFPASNVMRKLGNALGAGCSIIMKADEETPSSAIAMARCFQDAGLPDGVLNLVFGVPSEISSYLLDSPIIKKLSFTGSTPVGMLLQAQAAKRMIRCTMELGGHAPVMIFNDADIAAAAQMCSATKFRNAGQVCISPTRFYVQEGVYDEFAERMAQHAKDIVVAEGITEGAQMGPLIGERRLGVMQDLVDDAVSHGAELLAGGERLGNKGFFYKPTVLKGVPEEAKIMNEEPFGPVAPVASFKDFDEVIERANKLEYGLASYAFTTDGAKANAIGDQINAGMFGVNHFGIATPETPFGGVNHSGYGTEGGEEGITAYQRVKFISEIGV